MSSRIRDELRSLGIEDSQTLACLEAQVLKHGRLMILGRAIKAWPTEDAPPSTQEEAQQTGPENPTEDTPPDQKDGE